MGFLSAFFVVLLATPSLIKVAKLKHLVDEPGEERKLHKRRVPTIGGIIIFSAILFSYTIWFPDDHDNLIGLSSDLRDFKYIIASLIILFFVGVKDDIIGTAPMKKLLAHLLVAFIIVMMAEIRITSMHGLFGVYSIPEYASVLLSFFVYIVIVNGINLIDGLDGLAGGVGVVIAGFMGTWFLLAGSLPLALLSFVLAGALMGFLVFNFKPARVFMGDSGSLTIGCIVSILAIRMIEYPTHELPEWLGNVSAPVLAMAILMYPLIDTLRVFMIRAAQGNSPFTADKNHIHHKILAHNLNHGQTVMILYLVNILTVLAVTSLGVLDNPTVQFLFALLIAVAMLLLPFPFLRSRLKK